MLNAPFSGKDKHPARDMRKGITQHLVGRYCAPKMDLLSRGSKIDRIVATKINQAN